MKQRTLTTGQTNLVSRPDNHVPKNTFNLSNDNPTSFNIGELVPVYQEEILPGDSIRISPQCLTRFAPLVAPAYTRYTQRTEYFFVPYRIIWPDSDDFFFPPNAVAQPVPVSVPYLHGLNISAHSTGDYLNLPLGNIGEEINCLHVGAVNRIIYDWYVDENLDITHRFPYLVSGDNNSNVASFGASSFTYKQFLEGGVYKRQQDKDYFTSCIPWPQKGPVVTIPVIDGNVPVSVLDNSVNQKLKITGGVTTSGVTSLNSDVSGNLVNSTATSLYLDPNGSLGISAADMATHAGTIEELRKCVALQKFLEADARGGTRAVEGLQAHWGARQPDYRANRAEYLGRIVQNISIGEVLQTGESGTTPQGNMAGHGISIGSHSSGIHYSSTEYGVCIGITSVIPMTGYYQGLPRNFSRFDRLDYAWPELAHLGEQKVLNKEVYFSNNSAVDNAVFAYTSMYNEYRTSYSKATGDFRTSLDYWHGLRKFSALPAFNDQFQTVQNDVDQNRIFADVTPSDDHILCFFHHDVTCHRGLPLMVMPGF